MVRGLPGGRLCVPPARRPRGGPRSVGPLGVDHPRSVPRGVGPRGRRALFILAALLFILAALICAVLFVLFILVALVFAALVVLAAVILATLFILAALTRGLLL